MSNKYGWVPDLPDHRDYQFVSSLSVESFPRDVDMRSSNPPAYDQTSVGSCTGNCIAGAIEFDQLKQKVKFPFTPSRLFIYYNERVMEKTVKSDAGAMIRDGIKSVATLGAPPEKYWPYDVNKWASKPSKAAYTKAKYYTITKYQRVNQTLDDMKACLAGGFPFVFGFTVYESFESDTVAQTGIVSMPQPNESVLGGHAVLCVGYNDDTQRFIVRNSWGTSWGQNGYFEIPYAYLTNPNLADDFWVINATH